MSIYASDTAEKMWAAKRQAPVITDYIPPTGPEESPRPKTYTPMPKGGLTPMYESDWGYGYGYDYGHDLPEFYSVNGFYKPETSMWEKLGGDKLNLLFTSGLDLLKGLGGSENALMGNMNYPNNTGMEMQRRPDMETQRRQDEMYRDMMRAQQYRR